MEGSLESSIPSEEIKMLPIKNQANATQDMQNPLIHNKGSAKTNGKNSGILPFVIPATPPSSLLEIVDENESLNVKNELIREQNERITKVTPGNLNEETLSISSEMNSSERFKRLTVFQLPVFEVHTTMKNLIERKMNEKSCINIVNKKETEKILKAKTMNGTSRREAENMMESLSKSEFEYFTIMNKYNTNYLKHVLNFNAIYFQYAEISKIDTKFIHTDEFINKRNNILLQKKNFTQNTHKYQGKKTLVLDLDETLVLVSYDKLENYDKSFTLSEGEAKIKVCFI